MTSNGSAREARWTSLPATISKISMVCRWPPDVLDRVVDDEERVDSVLAHPEADAVRLKRDVSVGGEIDQ